MINASHRKSRPLLRPKVPAGKKKRRRSSSVLLMRDTRKEFLLVTVRSSARSSARTCNTALRNARL